MLVAAASRSQAFLKRSRHVRFRGHLLEYLSWFFCAEGPVVFIMSRTFTLRYIDPLCVTEYLQGQDFRFLSEIGGRPKNIQKNRFI
jgi:hypothetical protein